MGETPRRSAFRLPWIDGSDDKSDGQSGESAVAPGTEVEPAGGAQADPPVEPAAEAQQPTPATPPAAVDEPAPQPEPTPFLRELVDAMRGVAESSRESTLSELRVRLDERIEQLQSAAAERADDLRRRSEHDITAIGEWERAEIDRVRGEAEQRRDARRAKLDRELNDHQAASDREMEATRRQLADYEHEVAAFFSELTQISDPATFVSAAKRMPQPPNLGAGVSGSGAEVATSAAPPSAAANGAANPARSEMSLSQRLAELDQQLAAEPADETASEIAEPAPSEPDAASRALETAPSEPDAASSAPETAPSEPEAAGEPEATEQAVTAGPTPAEASSAGEPAPAADALTPIVVKGLGSFGAITSFKQALERVDGIHGVTLSLGPTGEFVYRASHGPEFDVIAAIRQIEGPGAGVEESEGQILVTIERQR